MSTFKIILDPFVRNRHLVPSGASHIEEIAMHPRIPTQFGMECRRQQIALSHRHRAAIGQGRRGLPPPGPTSRIAGARMKMARNGSDS